VLRAKVYCLPPHTTKKRQNMYVQTTGMILMYILSDFFSGGNTMNENLKELIQDLLSIYFTKREQPNMFEVDTIERAVEAVKDVLDKGTYDSYTYWVEKYKEE
jgi:hypothetical protein